MLTEVPELNRGQHISGQIRRRGRAHDLPAVRHRHQPRCPIQRRTEVITAPTLRNASMQPHPNAKTTGLAPRLAPQPALGLHGCLHRIARRHKHRVDPIPRRLHNLPAMTLDRTAKDLIMTSQRRLHRGRMLLPKPRRTLKIREQKRHRAGRQLSHLDPLRRP